MFVLIIGQPLPTCLGRSPSLIEAIADLSSPQSGLLLGIGAPITPRGSPGFESS
ncbi:hypothetical protein NG799_01135 [Laspinema sp. D1]|uniref:Uncharacterized protein n=1 Tax=Laspinema palackyanum D2a TaxID=2953684 RepID=A0ABT2MJM1_9CYAN|nr:hypothetical protein [Laspinema sp. D2a]